VTAEDGAEYRDQAYRQKHPVQPLDELKGRFGLDLGSSEETSMQEQRLGHEQLSVNTNHTPTIACIHQYATERKRSHKSSRTSM
jgi:hypothetical protein